MPTEALIRYIVSRAGGIIRSACGIPPTFGNNQRPKPERELSTCGETDGNTKNDDASTRRRGCRTCIRVERPLRE